MHTISFTARVLYYTNLALAFVKNKQDWRPWPVITVPTDLSLAGEISLTLLPFSRQYYRTKVPTLFQARSLLQSLQLFVSTTGLSAVSTCSCRDQSPKPEAGSACGQNRTHLNIIIFPHYLSNGHLFRKIIKVWTEALLTPWLLWAFRVSWVCLWLSFVRPKRS